jgi:hypothetical protein
MKIVAKNLRAWNPLCWLGFHKMGYELVHLNISWPEEERRETVAIAANVCQRHCGRIDPTSLNPVLKKAADEGYELLDSTIVMEITAILEEDHR